MTDWDAVTYRHVSSLQRWLAERAFAGLDFSGVRRLLDVGCGEGWVTAAITAQLPGVAVVGIDPSPSMIAAAPRGDRLEFRLGDAETMSFENEFDAVVSFNALHWALDQRAALARIAAALRRPGWALLVLVCAGRRPSVEDVAMAMTTRARWRDHFVGFAAPFVHPDPDAYQALVTDVGLRPAEWDVADLCWDFETPAAFAEWCAAGFAAWTQHLPASAARDFVDEVVDAYAAVTGSAQRFRFLQLRARLITS